MEPEALPLASIAGSERHAISHVRVYHVVFLWCIHLVSFPVAPPPPPPLHCTPPPPQWLLPSPSVRSSGRQKVALGAAAALRTVRELQRAPPSLSLSLPQSLSLPLCPRPPRLPVPRHLAVYYKLHRLSCRRRRPRRPRRRRRRRAASCCPLARRRSSSSRGSSEGGRRRRCC